MNIKDRTETKVSKLLTYTQQSCCLETGWIFNRCGVQPTRCRVS